MTETFGSVLKEWRQTRRMSQLDLGLSADVSSRHISFLETGRARPSRGMILRLCDQLEVPIAARNRLLTAAGLAPSYAARDLDDQAMAPVRAAVDWVLSRHDPYPAFAIDRHWNLQKLNQSAQRLFGAIGLTKGQGMIDAMIENPALQAAIVNRDEVLRYAIHRLRTESTHLGGDPVLDQGVARLTALLSQPDADRPAVMPTFVPTVLRLGGIDLSLVSSIAQFGSAEDVTLSELRIELMFPADAETATLLQQLGETPEKTV